MTDKKIGLYLLYSSFLSVGIYVWYIQFHLPHMPRSVVKLLGSQAFILCTLAGFSLTAFAQILRCALPLSLDDFRPNLSIVTFCVFALPLLPTFNLMAIPIPFIVLLALGGKIWLLFVAVPLVYLVAVLAEAADRPVAILLLFLWIAYLASLLVFGLAYI